MTEDRKVVSLVYNLNMLFYVAIIAVVAVVATVVEGVVAVVAAEGHDVDVL